MKLNATASLPGTMSAVVAADYGDPEVLSLAERPRPEIGPQDVLVQVRAAAIHAGDGYLLRGEPLPLRLATGLRRPTQPIPGGDLAGTVVAVGPEVSRFQIGDAVFGGPDSISDYGGALAEYCRVPEAKLAAKPESLDFAEAATLGISGTTALAALQKGGGSQPGQRVLVNGASGGVGSFAVQIAKATGAHVTAVCRGEKAEWMRQLGADEIIDYTREDFAAGPQTWDLVIDAACFRPLRETKRAAGRSGRYVVVGGSLSAPLQAILHALRGKLSGGPRVLAFSSESTPELLNELATLAESGKVRPAIDRRYTLKSAEEIRHAFAYLMAGHTSGKIVVEFASR